jgi:hypothetical protein
MPSARNAATHPLRTRRCPHSRASTFFTPQPRLHIFHAAAAAASRTQTVRGFARAAFRTARAPRSSHHQSRWVARRGKGRRLLWRSPSASGLAQREMPRWPSWWPRPPRSRRQDMLAR